MSKKGIGRVNAVIIALVIVIVLLASIAVYYATRPGEPEKIEPIKIGVLRPGTGVMATTGQLISWGALSGEKWINEKGGCLGRPIQVIVEDTESKPEKAVALAEKLITVDKVAAIIGPFHSSEAFAVIESTISEYKIPLILLGCFHDDLTGMHNRYVFRTGPLNSLWYEIDRDLMLALQEKYGWNKVAFIALNDDYGIARTTETAKLCEAAGLEVVDKVFVDVQAEDLTSEVLRLQAADPDMVQHYFVGKIPMVFTKQSYEMGSEYYILEMTGGQFPSEYFDILEDIGTGFGLRAFIEGFNYTEFAYEMDDYYYHMWGHHLGEYLEAGAFDTVKLLCEAIEQAESTDSEKLVDELEQIKFTGCWLGPNQGFEMNETAGSPWYHQMRAVPVGVAYIYEGRDADGTAMWSVKVIYPFDRAEIDMDTFIEQWFEVRGIPFR